MAEPLPLGGLSARAASVIYVLPYFTGPIVNLYTVLVTEMLRSLGVEIIQDLKSGRTTVGYLSVLLVFALTALNYPLGTPHTLSRVSRTLSTNDTSSTPNPAFTSGLPLCP